MNAHRVLKKHRSPGLEVPRPETLKFVFDACIPKKEKPKVKVGTKSSFSAPKTFDWLLSTGMNHEPMASVDLFIKLMFGDKPSPFEIDKEPKKPRLAASGRLGGWGASEAPTKRPLTASAAMTVTRESILQGGGGNSIPLNGGDEMNPEQDMGVSFTMNRNSVYNKTRLSKTMTSAGGGDATEVAKSSDRLNKTIDVPGLPSPPRPPKVTRARLASYLRQVRNSWAVIVSGIRVFIWLCCYLSLW